MKARGCRVLIRSLVTLAPLAALCAACTPAVVVESTRNEVSVGDESLRVVSGMQGDAQRTALLQQQLENQQREVEQLRQEVQRLRDSVPTGTTNAGRPTDGAPADAASAQSEGTEAAALRLELSYERERRQAAEAVLARLKEETSVPAFGDGRVPESDFLAVKQELVDLRRSAAEDHEARQHLAEEVRALQQRDASAGSAHAAGDNPELGAQLAGLQREKEELVQSLNGRLAASQQRTAELEAALTAAKAAPNAGPEASVGDGQAVAVENAALKARLEEEHQRTEALEAKLRIATRVSDLIYRIQSQPTAARAPRRKVKRSEPPPPPPPVPQPQPEYAPHPGYVRPPGYEPLPE